MALTFRVSGAPVAWSRTRIAIGRFGQIRPVNTAKLTDYEDQVASTAAIAARAQGWVLVTDEPIALQLHFKIPMPPSWSQKRKRESEGKPHESKPDLFNLCKAVEDGITKAGNVWRDDAQIVTATVSKRWAHPEDAGVSVEVRK